MRWMVENPIGNKVVLRKATFHKHIVGEHDDADAEFRKKLEHYAIQIIRCPQFIVKDSGRHLYFGLAAIPYENGFVKIKVIKVVVDIDRSPHEVVTWMILNKQNQLFNEEEIFYELSREGV